MRFDSNAARLTTGASRTVSDILVSVVIVSYNSAVDLPLCLASLPRDEATEVIVVDNASHDESVQLVRARFPWARIIEAGSNLGFGGALNAGAAAATGNVLIFSNPDIEWDRDAIHRLGDHIRRSGGVVGPIVLDVSSDRRWWGTQLDLLGMPVELDAPGHHFYLQGCAMGIDADLFERIGGFDPRYFLFAEDAELCWRAAGAGAPIAIELEAFVRHRGGQSEAGGYVKRGRREIALRRFTLRERNTLAMYLANAPAVWLVPFVPLYLAKLLVFSAWFVLTGRRAYAQALLAGIAWNLREWRRTLARRRSAPGRPGARWLLRHSSIRPAVAADIVRHGWPTFTQERS